MRKHTKNNHYLSRCISKNFIVKEEEPFWEYDFGRSMGPRVKGIEKLFAGRRLWGQDLEEAIGNEMENRLSGIIKRLVEEPVKRYRHADETGIQELQFNGYVIESKEERRILSKLILQTFLMQRNNARSGEDKLKNSNASPPVAKGACIAGCSNEYTLTDASPRAPKGACIAGYSNEYNTIEERLKDVFSKLDFSDKMNVFLMEINPLIYHAPLILLDGMLFLFLVPEKVERGAASQKLGHLSFMFPVSTDRFLIWGNKEDVDYFVMHYQNIDYLNLCRIEQHGKKCKAATQDKQYLESLIARVPRFESGDGVARIRLEREERGA